MNDTIVLDEQERDAVQSGLIEDLVQFLKENVGEERKKKKAGRPQQVAWAQIVAGVLVSVLFGMNNYQQLWRRLRRKELADFPKIKVQDDAIIKRLKNAGTEPFERLFEQWGHRPSVEGTACELARFAPKIVAIDEMSGDQMQRQLKGQRGLKKGDKQLLPGKLAGRFNIRTQQWEMVQWREDAQANCKVNVRSLVQGLVVGSLLLFDLGYFAFWWLDELSERGYWWVSRMRDKTSYELVHVFWRYEGNVDALIWLGAHRADRAGRMVRMVRIWDGEMLHTYITNVLDPRQMSLKEIVQLYARRWDIELAFLLLKEYLGLHHWWSSQPELLQQQCLAMVMVSQLLQGVRMQMAVQAGVDAFEVSLPLVVELLPQLLQEREDPLEWMRKYGRELAVIRPRSRLEPVVPEIVEGELVLPAQDLLQERKARYHSYGGGEEKKQGKVTKTKTGSERKRRKRKEDQGREEREGRKGGEGEGEKLKRGRGKREKKGNVSKGWKSKDKGETQGREEREKEVLEQRREREKKKEGKARESVIDALQEERKEEKDEPEKQKEIQKERENLPLVREGLPYFSG